MIYTSNLEYQIDIMVGLLKEQDIPAYVINKHDSMYNFGNYELYVDEKNYDAAMQVVNNAGM